MCALLPALREEWYEFLGYVIGFVFVGAIWVAHAGMTKFMRGADSIAYGINLLDDGRHPAIWMTGIIAEDVAPTRSATRHVRRAVEDGA